MKMKNYKVYIKQTFLLLAIIAISISCDELVDEEPISEIGPENFWRTPEDANAGVVAIYDAMQRAFSTEHYYWGEMRSDNYVEGSASASADRLELVTNNITSGNGIYRWNNFYTMINRANLAIKYIPDITGANPNLLAEAHALRAFAYFHGIRVWGSMPLFIEPIESQDQELQKPRTPASTILNDVILPDMLMAESLMEQFSNNFRFSETSILCLQAEVYMYMKDYEKAKEALDKLVDLGEFSLVNSVQGWQDLFLNDIGDDGSSNVFLDGGSELDLLGTGKIQQGPELILSINYDLLDNDRAGVFAIFFAGLPAFWLSPALENKWRERFPVDSVEWVNKYPDTEPQLRRRVIFADEEGELQDSLAPVYGDWRYYLSREDDIDLSATEIGEARLAKYNKRNYSANFDDSDIVLYRYSGMLLLLAEAENLLGNTERSLELVNEIRAARLLPSVNDSEFGDSEDDRHNFILDERQFELLGEGKRWWDLIRTDKAIEVLNPILDTIPNARQLTTERLLSPIFDEHLIENPMLEQTPGY